MSFYRLAKKLSPIISFIFRIRCEGRENMPEHGPVIVCSNHRSNIDPVLMGAVLDRNLYYMAKIELFKIPLVRLLLKSLGAFPVRRGIGDKEAIRKAVSILEAGNVLAMFPEGHRQKEDAEPRQFKSGAAQFACRTGAAILPAAIICKGRVRFYRQKIIRFGRPLSPAQLGFTDGSPENLRAVSEKLRLTVTELLEARS
jgi:1-acyl-sn-glycerol-3-phosphate acyltransferase